VSAGKGASGAEAAARLTPLQTALMARSPLARCAGRDELLPAARSAGKALGFFRGAEQRFGLVDAFLLLEVRI
jgi:hypothetical protein